MPHRIPRAASRVLARLAPGAVLLLSACAAGSAGQAPLPTPAGGAGASGMAAVARAHSGITSGYTPHRVYDVASGDYIDFEALAARAAAADVVFFGEQHGHAPAHRLQHALLEALARRGGATLSMEMFERDVAGLVEGYAAGTVALDTLIARARPWPRYATDYHPLVEEARRQGWRVVAANVPRPLASRIAQEGIGVLQMLPPAQRAHAAAALECPDDEYRTRFIEEMSRHPTGNADAEAEAARYQRYYESQCAKDETMAESIVAALQAGATKPVVHVNGAFHSDFGDGVPVRVRRRAPGTRILILTSVQAGDLDTADPAPHATRADYLLFTLAAPAQPAAGQ
jgi:uncharacterized iron-regulated protein